MTNFDTYLGQRCGWDGSITRVADTGECLQCYRYRRGIYSGRINGSNGMHPVNTPPLPPVPDFSQENMEVRD